MKLSLLTILALLPISTFAMDDVQPQARYNCFYQDSSLGYTHGAISFTLSRAKGEARRSCEEFLHRNDLSGRCSFVGCRTINTFTEVE